jgi:hypothetical protein
MRIGLQRSDLGGLDVALPPGPSGEAQRVQLRMARGLSVEVRQGPEGISIPEVQVEEAVLEALGLVFGTVALRQGQGATLGQLRGTVERRDGETHLDLTSATVHAGELTVETPSVYVQGELRVEGLRLQVDGGEGRIEGDKVHAARFTLGVGDTKATAPEVQARGLRLGWGEAGFWMRAEQLAAPSLRVALNGLQLHAHGVAVEGFHLHGPQVSVATGRLERASVSARFSAPSGEVAAPEPPPDRGGERPSRAPQVPFDWRLLDGLSGDIGVDLAVDLTVPVIGRRRATHRFRIPLEAGSLDYMALEGDLSTLEESLLDFAVRDDGTLVLERGIPLLPTRGRGKPILVWNLDHDDLALARKRRVRLAVLPHFRLASDAKGDRSEAAPDESPPEKDTGGSGPGIALRSLGLANLVARLAHAEVPDLSGPVRRLAFDALHVEGTLHHAASGAPRDGWVRGSLDGLAGHVAGLALGGATTLDLERLQLGRLSDLDVQFAGLRPVSLQAEVAELNLGGFALTPGEG